jgi:muramidase (phage lysozyme)
MKKTIFIIFFYRISFASFYDDQYILNHIDTILQRPQVKALLDTISESEGTFSYGYDSYRMILGGRRFTDFSKHPNILVKVKGLPLSTAAGRYQIIIKTWKYLQNRYNLKDFSPKNQDRAAILLIKERFGLRDLMLGRIDNLCKKIGKTWASMPYNNYHQPQKSMEYLRNFYNKRLNYYVNKI